MSTYHVIPLNDLKMHSESDCCKCQPRVQEEPKGRIVIHNAYDGREFHEPKATSRAERSQ